MGGADGVVEDQILVTGQCLVLKGQSLVLKGNVSCEICSIAYFAYRNQLVMMALLCLGSSYLSS